MSGSPDRIEGQLRPKSRYLKTVEPADKEPVGQMTIEIVGNGLVEYTVIGSTPQMVAALHRKVEMAAPNLADLARGKVKRGG